MRKPKGQPVRTPTGLPYGEAGKLQQAQQAVPLARQAPPQGGPGTPPRDPAAVLAAARAMAPPSGPLNRPTERPDESLMTPAQIMPPAPPDPDQLDLANLAPYLPVLEKAADQPTASIAFRNYVRRIRGAAMTRNGPV